MQIAALTTLACPIDRLALAPLEGGRGFKCERGHSYDVARDGHINLLLVQHKSSLNPGDGREMVAARRRVHAAGIYAPVAEQLFETVREPWLLPNRNCQLTSAGDCKRRCIYSGR